MGEFMHAENAENRQGEGKTARQSAKSRKRVITLHHRADRGRGEERKKK